MASLAHPRRIDEFSRIEQIKGSAPAMYSPRPSPPQTVAVALADCLPGEWMGVDDLFTTMRSTSVPPSRAARWDREALPALRQPRRSAGYHDWTLLGGCLAVLFEYAGTPRADRPRLRSPRRRADDFRDNWGGDFLDALSRDGLQAIRPTRWAPTPSADRHLKSRPNPIRSMHRRSRC